MCKLMKMVSISHLFTAVVLLVVLAATFCHGYTLVITEQESIVTDTAFTAGGLHVTALREAEAVAGLGARNGARFVVTVGPTAEGCGEEGPQRNRYNVCAY